MCVWMCGFRSACDSCTRARLNKIIEWNEEKTGCVVGVTLWANRENQNMDCLLAIMAG